MQKKRNTTVMIQARIGSSRFPSKVLAKIENKPMIWHVINRVKKIENVQQIALITTKKEEDKILLKIAAEEDITGFAGDTNNVLNRYYQCALKMIADPIIRITSDCPLIDPFVSSEILQFYFKNNFDYVSNTIEPTYPDGLDTEIFSFKTLEKTSKNANLNSEREHVTPYITKHPNMFRIFNFRNSEDLSHLRLTVDEKEDLKFVKEIYARMRPKTIFSMKEILKIISNEPKLLDINKNIIRNEGYLKSLEND